MSTHTSSDALKVVWALDPSVKDDSRQQVTAGALRILGSSLSMTIEPISVIFEQQIPYLIAPNQTVEDYMEDLSSRVQKWIEAQHIRGVRQHRTLMEPQLSVRAATQRLLSYAKEQGADLVALSTHAKKRSWAAGRELGTFAETLFLSNGINLMIVSPESVLPESFKRIVYATDLSGASLRGLDDAIPIAKATQLPITLFHQVEPIPCGSWGFPLYKEARALYLADAHARNEQELEKCTTKLRDQGIVADVFLDHQGNHYVAQSILNFANSHKGTLLALVSQTASQNDLPGSVTRQIIAGARVPVYVITPKRKEKHNASK